MTATTERDEAIAHLREILHPGDTVYTILRHRTRTGRKVFDFYMLDDGAMRWIGQWVADALGRRYNAFPWDGVEGFPGGSSSAVADLAHALGFGLQVEGL